MQVEHTRTYLVSEVAGHFEVSVATIYRAIESGQLDALKLGTPGEARCGWPGAAVLAYRQGVRTRVGGGWSMGCARQARRVRGERPRAGPRPPARRCGGSRGIGLRVRAAPAGRCVRRRGRGGLKRSSHRDVCPPETATILATCRVV